jgi:hypothetical protein
MSIALVTNNPSSKSRPLSHSLASGRRQGPRHKGRVTSLFDNHHHVCTRRVEIPATEGFEIRAAATLGWARGGRISVVSRMGILHETTRPPFLLPLTDQGGAKRGGLRHKGGLDRDTALEADGREVPRWNGRAEDVTGKLNRFSPVSELLPETCPTCRDGTWPGRLRVRPGRAMLGRGIDASDRRLRSGSMLCCDRGQCAIQVGRHAWTSHVRFASMDRGDAAGDLHQIEESGME